MPKGQVVWYDHNLGRGRIESPTGHYTVEAADAEPAARTEGAWVHFDAVRAELNDRAVNVTLRRGTRNDPKQRRFGDTG